MRARLLALVGSAILLLTVAAPVGANYTPGPNTDATLFDVMDRMERVENLAPRAGIWKWKVRVAKNAIWTLIDFRNDGTYPRWARACRQDFRYHNYRGLKLSRALLQQSRAARTGYDSFLNPTAAKILLRAKVRANLREYKDAREDLELCVADRWVPFRFRPFLP